MRKIGRGYRNPFFITMALTDLNLIYNDRSLTEEQFNQLLSLLSNKYFVKPTIIPTLKENEYLSSKFINDQVKMIKSNERKTLGKILRSIKQQINGDSLPVFKYEIGKDRYSIIYDMESYNLEAGTRYLKTATNYFKHLPEVRSQLEQLIERIETLQNKNRQQN